MTDSPAWPQGGREMGALIRAHNWAATPLGPIESWPQSLRTTVDLVLDCPLPTLLLWGPERIQIHNEAYASMIGNKHPRSLGQRASECWAEVWDRAGALYDRAFAGEAVISENQKWTLLRAGAPADGWFTSYLTPVRDEAGAVAGVHVTAFETTEQMEAAAEAERAEQVLRERDAMLQTAVDLVGLGWVYWRPGSTELVCDERAKELWGLSPDASLDMERVLAAVHPEDRPSFEAIWIKGADPGHDSYTLEYRVIGIEDGVERWISAHGRTSFQNGEPVRFIGAVQDVTEYKRAAEHQRVLLAELQHRVRNALAVVRSIARRTAVGSDSVDEMMAHLQGRLDAFSRVQSAVTREADAGVDLASIIDDELVAHAAHEGARFRIHGPDVRLQPKAAESISLAIHELTTNAVKYGALSDRMGQLAVEWERETDEGGEWLKLVWSESGLDQPLSEPERKGFGLELLSTTLPYDLRARTEVEFRPQGLRFTMTMPLGPGLQAE